ncbi:MAG TPA: S9 family peptidase [Bryobacteraceae bacterium]|nr:S9 family peptidase [Bryobacteraceae bacterium]
MKIQFFALAGAMVLAALTAFPQETKSATRLTNDHYFDFERVSDAQISPDGAHIVYSRQNVNKIEDRWDSSLWIMNSDGSHHRFLTKGSSPRWASDGKRFLYIADGEPRGPQIFVRWIDADGPGTQVTHATENVADAHWSPDGKWIAFSMFVPAKDNWNISMPAAPSGAKWTAAPRAVDTLHYRQDRVGFLQDGHTHLFVVSSEGGAARQLSNDQWIAGAGELRSGVQMDWTPDSKAIVFQGDRVKEADLHYQISELLVADMASGALRELVSAPGNWGRPSVSPDGRTVAFTGYPHTNRTHSVADLYVIPLAGGEMKKISGNYDRDPLNLRWTPDSSGLYFDADDHGSRNIQYAGLTDGVKPVTIGVHVLTMDSASSDLMAAGTETDPDNPPDVVMYNLRRPFEKKKLTDVNAGLLAGMHLAKTEEINFASSGNAKVQGWVVKPPDFDPNKKYPLILEIHGGPFAMYNVAFNYMFQNFAANDFAVLYINPRGSTGYGTAFSGGIDHNYPGPDYDDLIAAVDTTVGKGFIDTTRMYVSGCSGGGVLSSWVIGHTDRFAAAAVRCPVIDWLSMTGNTDIPLFTYSFFQKPFWEDPTDWLSHSSVMTVGKVTTPTLLMTGVLDRRTPMPQTEEYYAALKVRGVPVKLLQFEGEYHGTASKPSNFIRTQLYMMSWFKKYARTASGQSTAVSTGGSPQE